MQWELVVKTMDRFLLYSSADACSGTGCHRSARKQVVVVVVVSIVDCNSLLGLVKEYFS